MVPRRVPPISQRFQIKGSASRSAVPIEGVRQYIGGASEGDPPSVWRSSMISGAGKPVNNISSSPIV